MFRQIVSLSKIIEGTKVVNRCLSTSSTLLDQHWREAKGQPLNPNSFGPLTNLPDYTYLDGRVTPLGTNQKKRILYQREVAAKMVSYLKELDYAKKRYAKIQEDKANEKKHILKDKLKAKGPLLLKKGK